MASHAKRANCDRGAIAIFPKQAAHLGRTIRKALTISTMRVSVFARILFGFVLLLSAAVVFCALFGSHRFEITGWPKASTRPTNQENWSTTEVWTANQYTKTLFEFLRAKLSQDYIYSHFELVDPQRVVSEPKERRVIRFRLHYGAELAYTHNASGTAADPSFVSGNAWIADGVVRSYTGPLKEYEINIGKNQAKGILEKNGVSKVVVPGARRTNALELWIQDDYSEGKTEETDSFYWVGGVTYEESIDWYWVHAANGSLRKEMRYQGV